MTNNVQTYDVMREHEGDRFYKTGDTRKLSPTDAAVLVGLGVLADHDPERFKGADLHETDTSNVLAKIDVRLEERRIEVDQLLADEETRLNDARTKNSDAILALEDDLTKARTAAEDEMLKINGEVSAARDAATAEITKINADLAGKKAEVEVANKAEKPLKNKAE